MGDILIPLLTLLPIVLGVALATYLLVVMVRFVRAHERIAEALEDLARRPPVQRSSPG